MLELNITKEWDYTTPDIENKIKECIQASDSVYIKKEYQSDNEKNDLIKWLDQQNCEYYDSMQIKFNPWNKVYPVESKDGFKVRYILFNDNLKNEFLERFKVSIIDVKNALDFHLETLGFFVEDETYEDYNFIFMKNNSVLMYADMHPVAFYVNGELLCQKESN